MEEQLTKIREQQKESWDRFSPGWKKWDELNMGFLRPFGDEMIKALDLKTTDSVLDVACGTGEPGLTIASIVKDGNVMLTDLSDGMLEIARERAATSGLTNIKTQACDVCELPFAADTFDAISCRMGFMFFPDMLLAASEMVRVLKPGGKVAASVWGSPDKNFWVTAIMGTINKHIAVPSPPPGAPGMFRCAKDDFMAGLFAQAGLENITSKQVAGKMNCHTVENYWDWMTEVGAPIVAALSKASDETKERIRLEVFDVVTRQYAGPDIAIDAMAVIVYGEKPL